MIVKPGIPKELQWFQDARFGMFVHFGIYALLGRGEWVMYHEHIRKEEYEKLVPQFNPNCFDAEDWVMTAKNAGCKYINFTSKHHDGFCMFDSEYTDYKITNTPYGKDLMRELVDACHKHDMRIIIYYSQPDWHHINYVHHAGAYKDLDYTPEGQQPDWPKFKQYIYNQVEEICTKYGRIDGIFFDGSHKSEEEWGGKAIYDMIKRHQPHAVVNDRARCGDMFTPERAAVENIDRTLANKYLLEICTSVTGWTWGYVPESDRYTVSYHLEQMVKAARIGCNYLLNVGPKPDGTIPEYCKEVYRHIGRWMEKHGEGYIGTKPLYPFMDEDSYVMLYKRNVVYLFCLKWPMMDKLEIPYLSNECRSVKLMSTGEEIPFFKQDDSLFIKGIPLCPPDGLLQAFRIELEGEVKIVEKKPEPIVIPEVLVQDETILNGENMHVYGYGVKGAVLKAVNETIEEMADGDAPKGKPLTETCISGWMTPDQHAAWKLHAETEGKYVISLVLLIDRDYEDAQFELLINKNSVYLPVPKPGQEPTTVVEVGDFMISKGENKIDISAPKLLWGYACPPIVRIVLKKQPDSNG